MKKSVILFTTLILLINCKKDDINESEVSIDKEIISEPISELISELNSKSCDTLIIKSNKLVLDAYLWRDFMPISPPDGKPMISINWLRDIDSIKISDNIDLIEQYVIYKDTIWTAGYENESRPTQPDYKIEKTSREGPKWGPKIYVDVISKVHDSNTNSDYYIRNKNIYVERSD